MLPTDTIVAVSSGWGPSPRSLLRLSGPSLPEVLRAAFDPVPAPHGSIVPARLRMTPALSLPCLLFRSDAPRSFTGQHMAEILLPGGPILLERILEAFCRIPGVREAGPGEFSARAYLAGKLDLTQAEGLAATIAARTDAQLRAARLLTGGQAGRTLDEWTSELATLLALVEAGIDFTDQEDVVPIHPERLRHRLEALRTTIAASLGAAAGAEDPNLRPAAALIGPPNAGKSTLFNALLARVRAVESPIPGTTRDVLSEPLDLGEVAPGTPGVLLMDLPGLDVALAGASPLDAAAQARALDAAQAARVLIHCDPAGRFVPLFDHEPTTTIIRVRTKADLPTPPTPPASADLSVCALDGWNLPILRRAIADAAWPTGGSGQGDPSAEWALPRHRRVLATVAETLQQATHRLSNTPHAAAVPEPELIAGDLRAALDILGEITGHISPDEVIGRIFATFCVGK